MIVPPPGGQGAWAPYPQQVPPPRANFLLGDDGKLRPGWRLTFYLVLFLLCLIVGQTVVLVVYTIAGGRALDFNNPILLMLSGSLNLPAALLPAYLLWRFVDKRPFQEMGFELNGRKIALDTLLGLGLGVLTMGGIFLLELALGLATVEEVRWEPLLPLTFVFLLAAAAGEEIAIRGYAYHTTVGRWGVMRAVLVTSLIFGLLHGGNPNVSLLALVNIFFAGAVFVAQLIATGNLWLPMAFHFMWNFMQGPVFGFPVSGIDFPSATELQQSGTATLFTGGVFGPEAGLFSTIALALVLLPTLLQIARNRGAQRQAS